MNLRLWLPWLASGEQRYPCRFVPPCRFRIPSLLIQKPGCAAVPFPYMKQGLLFAFLQTEVFTATLSSWQQIREGLRANCSILSFPARMELERLNPPSWRLPFFRDHGERKCTSAPRTLTLVHSATISVAKVQLAQRKTTNYPTLLCVCWAVALVVLVDNRCPVRGCFGTECLLRRLRSLHHYFAITEAGKSYQLRLGKREGKGEDLRSSGGVLGH